MNRKELVAAAAERTGHSARDVDHVLDAVLEALTTALVAGDKVQIAGFGSFEVRSRPARMGRNPQTGEAIDIAASSAPAFKPALAFKRAIGGQE